MNTRRDVDVARLADAIGLRGSNDIAHALIYFEVPEPTIARSVELAIADALKSLVDKNWSIWGKSGDNINEAVQARKARLGDALWYSNH